MRKGAVVSIVFLALVGLNCASALAGGGGAYPKGAEGAFVGMAPPPGFTFVNYMMYYHADDFMDNTGDKLSVFDDASVYAEVMRFIWISNQKIFGADYGQHFFLPVLHADIDFNAPVGPKGKRRYSDHNIPYFIYSPAILAWHACGGKLHAVAATDIFIPLYNEEGGNLASVGRNFWTIEPVLAVTWLPIKQLEISAKFMYDFNTKQDDMPHPSGFEFDRTPGQEFHFDYNISYAVLENLRLGAGGYFYWQTTDDDFDFGNDVPLPAQAVLKTTEDDLSRVWAIGPGVWYQHKNMFFELRSQFEMDAENITEGFNAWFKFSYVF